MGTIAFSVFYKNEGQAKLALKNLRRKKIPVKNVKVFIRDNDSDQKFLNMIRPSFVKKVVRNGLFGAIVGIFTFLVLWSFWQNIFSDLSLFRILLLAIISGTSVGIFLGVTISVISKESTVAISLEDLSNESVVLDFKSNAELRETIESILKKSGADNILED